MLISDWSSDVCSSDLLKPYNGNHGRGITIDISGDDEIREAFNAAREHSRSVIVETFQPGDDHRLLVINGELIAATKRTPGHVRSEEHTSELQSLMRISYAVFCLKKKKTYITRLASSHIDQVTHQSYV